MKASKTVMDFTKKSTNEVSIPSQMKASKTASVPKFYTRLNFLRLLKNLYFKRHKCDFSNIFANILFFMFLSKLFLNFFSQNRLRIHSWHKNPKSQKKFTIWQ